ncbi:MAG: hypothetical protein HC936_01010 [Leptolyngbyaceae cyanobacterium SU_3_3]|nr:hypothetical protein [Leptolyngbyaceae cyanobacterium SU_3_3]
MQQFWRWSRIGLCPSDSKQRPSPPPATALETSDAGYCPFCLEHSDPRIQAMHRHSLQRSHIFSNL